LLIVTGQGRNRRWYYYFLILLSVFPDYAYYDSHDDGHLIILKVHAIIPTMTPITIGTIEEDEDEDEEGEDGGVGV